MSYRSRFVAFALVLGLIGQVVASSPAAAAPLSDTNYTVRSGDTLSAIGARCGVGWQRIAAHNQLANPNRISAGQSISIPGSSGCNAPAAPKAAAAAPAAPAPAQPAAAPAVAYAPARAGFGYGIQLHAPGGDQTAIDQVRGMGFNWIKQQVEWFRYEPSKGSYDFGGLDNLANQANAAGIKVMFSVVKAPHWARGGQDMSVEGPPNNSQDYADFIGAMANHFRGRVHAYEIWNEQNLHYEWGNKPINAGEYTRLLCGAYGAVKAQDGGAVVVSGALTPTGVNDGRLAVDDVNYLSQMFANGAGRCADAIGVHPSGYNNPANVRPGWNNPAEPQFKGHRSFYFRGTMEAYRAVMNRYGLGGKLLWPTEFGWASSENMGAPAAGYEYAGQNTEGEQAQFLVDAFNLGRSWGYVGPMFVWNLNFAPVAGPADEKAAFGLVRADWSPRPAYSALANMPK